MIKKIINFILSAIVVIGIGYCLILLGVYMQDHQFILVVLITAVIFAIFGIIRILRFIWNQK